MKKFSWLLFASMSLIAAGCNGMASELADVAIDGVNVVGVLMQTEMGEIRIAVDAEQSPVTAQNFLRYVNEGFYDGGQFHRTVRMDNQPNDQVKIEVIQGSSNRAQGRGYEPIPLERTNVTGLRHTDGAISMARSGPDTATSSFFICIGDQPELDFGGKRNADGQGFGAFGRVIEGMDVVRKIQVSSANGQNLDPPIRIIKMSRFP